MTQIEEVVEFLKWLIKLNDLASVVKNVLLGMLCDCHVECCSLCSHVGTFMSLSSESPELKWFS